MGTEQKSVGDEKQKVTDEQIGKLQRKTNEIIRRVNEGTISYDDALAGMQGIIEGKSKRLRLDLIPQKKWWEENGVIYFKVTSDGTTGKQWIARLEKKGFILSEWSKELLLSKDFKPTTGIVYTIAVLKGDLFVNVNRISKKILNEATKRKLVNPNPEVACLIREMFNDDEIKAMDLKWIITFHKPIKDSRGDLCLLNANCYDRGFALNVNNGNFDRRWTDRSGFAFEVSQISL